MFFPFKACHGSTCAYLSCRIMYEVVIGAVTLTQPEVDCQGGRLQHQWALLTIEYSTYVDHLHPAMQQTQNMIWMALAVVVVGAVT